jgi:thiol-disulfide isomerase/thioredoxin
MANAKSVLGYGEMIGLGLLLAALTVIVWPRGSSGAVVPVGTPLPEVMVEGWLNTSTSISRESLLGKVVVVDCWATWCAPCRAAMPRLARVYDSYRDSDVEFIGLTSESEAQRSAVEGYISSVKGFEWPVGYGAGLTQDMLGIEFLPTLVVFGKDGRAVWSSPTTEGLEVVLDEALRR